VIHCWVDQPYACIHVCRLSQEEGRSRRTAAAAVNYKEPALGRQVMP